MHKSQLKIKYLKTKLKPTSNYTKNIKISVITYTRGKEENIAIH